MAEGGVRTSALYAAKSASVVLPGVIGEPSTACVVAILAMMSAAIWPV